VYEQIVFQYRKVQCSW